MRVAGWEQILDAKIEEAASRAFEWGRFDCCRFAAECADAISGSSHLAFLETQYGDERSALRRLAELGGVRAATTLHMGEPIEGWARARRGDVCLIPTDIGDGLGVCTGAAIAGVSDKGVGLYRLDKAIAVWRVD